MKLKYTNIDVQLVIGFSIVFILTVLMSSVAWIQTRQMYQQVQVLYNHPLMVSRAIGELRFDILIVQREMRDLLLANNEKEISDALLTIGIYNDRASKQVLILKDLYLGDRKDIDIINNAMVDWNFKRTEIVKLVREGKTAEAIALTQVTAVGTNQDDEELLNSLQKVDDFAANKAASLLESVKILNSSLNIRLAFITIFIILLSAGILYYFLRLIRVPLKQLTAATEEFGRGNMEARSPYVSTNEIGILSGSFNKMAQYLQTTLVSRDELAEEVIERTMAEENLKNIVGELTRSNEELQHFAHVASHDLQEPLRMVASYVQLLERRYKDNLGSDANDFITFAVDGTKRMQNLINDLLAYSRVGSQAKPFRVANMDDIITAATTGLSVVIAESAAEVTHDRLPTVVVDEGQMVQVFQNLFSNAIKFHGKEPPRVHISAQQKKDKWIFSVKDNGIGIEPQYWDRIFLIFQRLHGQEIPGTGAGLSIVKKIVERHGGRVWVESEPGKGSTFYFSLPMKGGKQV